MTEITLRVPLPPPRNTSSDRHWSSRAKGKKKYYAAADLATLKTRFPSAPFAKVEATAVVYAWNRDDEDNCMARMKSIQDWCKSRGIVIDDSPRHWHWTGVPDQVIERKQDAYVILTLRAVG